MALKTALSFMYMHPHLRITCSYIQWQAKKLTHCNFSYPESRLSIQISELDSDQMHGNLNLPRVHNSDFSSLWTDYHPRRSMNVGVTVDPSACDKTAFSSQMACWRLQISKWIKSSNSNYYVSARFLLTEFSHILQF